MLPLGSQLFYGSARWLVTVTILPWWQRSCSWQPQIFTSLFVWSCTPFATQNRLAVYEISTDLRVQESQNPHWEAVLSSLFKTEVFECHFYTQIYWDCLGMCEDGVCVLYLQCLSSIGYHGQKCALNRVSTTLFHYNPLLVKNYASDQLIYFLSWFIRVLFCLSNHLFWQKIKFMTFYI